MLFKGETRRLHTKNSSLYGGCASAWYIKMSIWIDQILLHSFETNNYDMLLAITKKRFDKKSSLVLCHPIDSVRPNGQLAVNFTGFGCTTKGHFVIIPEFYRFSLWEVLHMLINIMNHFCMTTKFSKHECNHKLSYPDHSRYDNINFHYNL